jgi:hypothetical protein
VRYYLASERERWLPSPAMFAGVSMPPDPLPVPAGRSHAVAFGAKETACGRSSRGLFDFPTTNFETTSTAWGKCEACQQAVRREQACLKHEVPARDSLPAAKEAEQ